MKRKVVAPPSTFNSDVYGSSRVVAEGKKPLFISGQLAADRSGNLASGDFRQQCKMALDGIGAVLEQAGGTRMRVVKITAYVIGMKNSIEEFVKQTKEYFAGWYPASTLVQVSGLAFPGQLVEIEAVAII